MRISPQSIEFGLWCNGSTTGFGSVCLGSNPGKPTEKEQWNPLLFFCLNNSRHVIFPIPLFVAIAPLFLPYILRYKTQGRSAQCILIPKLKHHFQSSPPAVSRSIAGCSVREYRGSVRRTRGLTLTVKNLMPSFSHPLLRNYRFFGLFPIFFYTIPRNAIGHGEGEGQTRSVSLINNEIEGH